MTNIGELPLDFGKMPADYNFSHKGIKWDDYNNDFKLRTDAVWEKTQLRDWFRLYMRVFYYDKAAGKYSMIEPEEMYTLVYEPWAMEDMFSKFIGYNPTGRTNCFQVGQPPKQRVHVPFATFQTQQDFFTLCALRFERWMQCDQSFHYNGKKDTDEAYIRTVKNYPCYGVFYETSAACQDDAFDFLMEIAYSRRTNQFFDYNHYQHEMQNWPTVYDSPKNAERIKKTY